MHPLLVSLALCFVAQVAAAQAVPAAAPAAAQAAAPASGVVVASAGSAVKAAPEPAAAGGELIKTAAAGPREVSMRQSPAGAAPGRPQDADEEQPHRTGPAMLLAALAAMTAIALRRWGASGR